MDTPFSLNGLNSEQKRAVETVNGRVLILAGAGSGKTRVLTVRMAYLIRDKGVHPSMIMGLTFTNKAAQEMKKRMGELIPLEQAKKVTLSTFHSFCLKVLREDIHHLGFTKEFTLWDQGDVERVIKIMARDILGIEAELPSLQPTFELIAKARSQGIKSGDMNTVVWHDAFAKEVFTRLKDAFRAFNALDFDSLLIETVELFERFPDVLKKWQDRFQYVMIDEYQDTNPIQFKLTELLTRSHGNLCVVGDDDQSIYGWRGATVQNILEFGNATCIKLEQNFRSTNTILEAANQVIKHNSQRHSKKLWSQKGDGQKIEIFHTPTEIEEAESVVARLAKIKAELKVGWSHFAILYRSNALSRQFEMALLKQMWQDGDGTWIKGVPYQVFGGLEFYERKEVKDLLAYLKIMQNPLDEEAILRVINYPRRGIGEQTLDAITAYNRQNKEPLWNVLKKLPQTIIINDKAKKSINFFLEIIEEGKVRFQSDLKGAMIWLVDKINYKKAISEEVKSDKMQQFKWENVEELITAIGEHEGSLQDFLSNHLLDQTQWKKDSDKSGNKVSLMTFHSSKGLEFPVCFLVGLEDHIIPHEKSIKESGVEEERRLMYVALTRAQEKLVLSMARVRRKMGHEIQSTPSRFILDIPKELLLPVKWHEI